MEHLRTYFQPEKVLFNLAGHETEIEKLFGNKDFGYQSFGSFLEEKGWKRTQEGWLDRLESKSGSNENGYAKRQILQAWLFFGLLACIVRTDEAFLNWHEFVVGSHPSRYLNTETLPGHLQTWHDWMKTSIDRPQLQRRLIDADRTLELARRVVRANLVDARFRSEMGDSLSGTPEDGTNISSDRRKEHDSGEDHVQPELALCLMLLGETLSAAKTQLVNDLGLRINGWLTDDDAGWGPPSYVPTKMDDASWCVRTQEVLRGQLGSSAFLLCLASEKHPVCDPSQHAGCSPEVCLQMPGRLSGGGQTPQRDGEGSEEAKTTYPAQHHEQRPPCPSDCAPLGPKMKLVFDTLENSNLATEAYEFPLFRIISQAGEHGRLGRVLGITVEKWSRQDKYGLRRPDFATISHVWSQGMGNGTSNALQECQLRFLRQILTDAGIEDKDSQTPTFVSDIVRTTLGQHYDARTCKLSPPFWMDTLAIPVSSEGESPEISPKRFLELKRRAIRQIYHVYNSATLVLVIDKELCKTSSHESASVIAMQILTSAWMRRLWTLQEAFLSRRLLIALKGEGNTVMLEDVDRRMSELGTVKDGTAPTAFHLSMAELIKHKLYHNLMGEDREIRNRKDHPIETRGSMVIASAWRSSRWRSTSRFQDETLALSTLLNLDYQRTEIEKASTTASIDDPSKRKTLREVMMKDFWTLIHRSYEGSIPAGLIFLPGERLSLPGFGWAPITWLSGMDEAYPYPLNVISKPTELHEEGLLVQYPGFLLHGGHPKVILGSDHFREQMKFPVDHYLSEWYKTVAIQEFSYDKAARNIISRLETADNTRPQFGIILSRPKPKEWPEEIGLLVEIYSEISRRKEPQRINKKIYCCRIIRRLWVSRATTEPNFRLPSGKENDSPIGELMPEDTLWYVDGYDGSWAREESMRPLPSDGEDQKGSMMDKVDQDRPQKLGLGSLGKSRQLESEAKDSSPEMKDRSILVSATNGNSSMRNPPSSNRRANTIAQEPATTLPNNYLTRMATTLGLISVKGKEQHKQPHKFG